MTKVLLVDDEEEICDFLSEFFTRRGLSTRKAVSAEEALKQIEAEKPDLCLLDVKMPRVAGWLS